MQNGSSFTTEFNTSLEVISADDEPVIIWVHAKHAARFCGFVITLLGFVGNGLCYLTAKHMPDSISVHLIKYLAVWDSLSSIHDGVFDHGLRFFKVELAEKNVCC